MQHAYPAIQESGAQVIALAVAPLNSIQSAREAAGATYPMLADPAHEAAGAFGIYDLLGDGLAAPSVFVIDATGHVVWYHVGQGPADRPSAATIVKHLP